MPLTPSSPRISYRIHGTEGPPVLLIMGLGMRGVVWRPQVEGLAETHQLVTFDNRGIGASEDVPGPWSVADMAEDALRVLDGIGWESAHVVGVSMGGMIAQELAIRAPGRLRSLTLIATHAGGARVWFPSLSGIRGFLSVNLLPPEERFYAMAYLLYPADFLRVVDRDQLVQRMADQVGTRASRPVRKKQFAAVWRHDTRERLPRVEVPSLVVCPGRDALIRAPECAKLARLLPNAELIRFDQAGHGVTFQCAPVLNRHLARHFATHEPLLPHVRVHA